MSNQDTPTADPDAPPADPDELDFADDESVAEIGDGRYVVGTNGRPNIRRAGPEGQPADDSEFTVADPEQPENRQPPNLGGRQENGAKGGNGVDAGTPRGTNSRPREGDGGRAQDGLSASQRNSHDERVPQVDRQAVSQWLANSFDGDGFSYGIDATLHADGDTSRQRMVSNDVTATFDSLVTWFASNTGPDSPTPEALGLLLVASETTVDLPPAVIKQFAASQGLSASDSIGDLVRAAEREGGFRIE